MKYDFILHARNKMAKYKAPNGDTIYKNKGITFKSIEKEDRDNYVVNSRGGVTVFIIKNHNDNTLTWSVSKCNMSDSYNKKQGRKQALNNSISDGIDTSDISFDEAILISKRLAKMINSRGYNAIKHIHNENDLYSLK